jgi:hypothetical protein
MNPSTLIENLTGLEPHLFSKIKGQGHVIARVCSVLERGQFGLQPTGNVPVSRADRSREDGIDTGIFPLPVR